MPTRPPGRSSSRALQRALGCAALFHLCALWVPWQPAGPAPDGGASWAHVINEAFTRGWQWGRDIAFPYGPFGFLLPKLAHPGTLGWSLALWTAIALAAGVAMLRLTSGRPLGLRIAVYVLFAWLTGASNEVIFFSAPLLAALLLSRSCRPGDVLCIGSLVVLGALGALTKASFAAAALASVLALDAHQLARRRPPLFSPLFAAAFLAFYLLAGQQLAQLGDFLLSWIEITAGYSAAMGREKRAFELPLYVGLSTGLFLLLWGRLRSDPALPSATRAMLLAIWVVVCSTAMKAGFTREAREHADIAWGSLVLCSVLPLTALGLWPHPTRRAATAWLALPIAGFFALRPLLADPEGSVARFGFQSVAQQGSALAALATRPRAFFDGQAKRWEDGLAWIRERDPLPRLRGSVDVIPSVQAALLAQGLDYRPRPVFQEYVAYSEPLLERNRRHLARPDGAASLLFRPGSIDRRYPSLAESTSWPILLGSFEPVGFVGFESRLLLLARAREPLPVPLVQLGSVEARLKQWIALPSEDTVFARVDLEPTLVGRLAALLFRLPALTLRVDAENGNHYSHRYVAAIGRAGFLLSPLVKNNTTFAALAFGRPDLFRGDRITRLRFKAGSLARWCYRGDFRIHWFGLDLSALRQREMPAEFEAALEGGGGS